jgi:S1-C subfamily serine protease
MKIRFVILVASILISYPWTTSEAGSVADIFNQVNSSVTVILAVHKAYPAKEGVQLQMGLASIGSGVLVSKRGEVITAAHLVQTADRIKVKLSSGETVGARVAASAPLADLALLQLESLPGQISAARLGDSGKMRVGDEVFVVGAPYGLSATLTVGHISARHKTNTVMGGFETGEFFQTDAAVNQGNSGGPMFNMAGEVIGIVSQILSKSGGFEGLGFAVTSNTAKRLLLEEKPFWLGFDGIVLTDELTAVFNLPQSMGVLVQRVAENSPAARLGLQPGMMSAQISSQQLLLGGDIILEFGGVQISEDCYPKIRDWISRIKPGDVITVKVLRAGRILQLGATRER